MCKIELDGFEAYIEESFIRIRKFNSHKMKTSYVLNVDNMENLKCIHESESTAILMLGEKRLCRFRELASGENVGILDFTTHKYVLD